MWVVKGTQTAHKWWKFYTVTLDRPAYSVPAGRADKGNYLPFVPAIDAKITFVNGDNRVMGIKLTHSNETEVGQIGLAIRVAPSQFPQLQEVSGEVKSYLQ